MYEISEFEYSISKFVNADCEMPTSELLMREFRICQPEVIFETKQ